MTSREVTCVIAVLCILGILAAPRSAVAQAAPSCGPGVDCAQRAMELANQLAKDNQALANRMTALERDLAAAHESIKRLGERKVILRDSGKDKEFPRGMFWTSVNPTYVNYTCPDRNVLVGMEFEMSGDGVGRHPSKIKFICRELTP